MPIQIEYYDLFKMPQAFFSDSHVIVKPKFFTNTYGVVVTTFKLGEPGSILGTTSTQRLGIIEEKELPLH